MELRTERLDLLHELIDQALRGNLRDRRDVVDRLLRIELGALAADLVENIDQVGLHIQEAQFEDGEKSARTRTNNQHIGLDRVAHVASFRFDGARTAWARTGSRLSSQRCCGRKAIII